METKREHRRLDLTPAEWQRLETLAEETSSRPRSGVNARQPDWRALIKRIASGKLVIVDPKPYQMPPGLDEAVQKIEHRRIVEHPKQARKQPLKLEQLQMTLEPA